MNFFLFFFGFFLLKFFIFFYFKICWLFFRFFMVFDGLLQRLLLKVTKVTTGNQKWLKMGQNNTFKSFFAQRAKKALPEGQSPPQELEEGPRSGPYLLVCGKKRRTTKNWLKNPINFFFFRILIQVMVINVI